MVAVRKPAGMPTIHTHRHAFLALPQHEETSFQQQQVNVAPRLCKTSNTLPVMLLRVLRLFYTFRIKRSGIAVLPAGTRSEKGRRIKYAG